MATLKYVYFCESDPTKWFEKQEDAERFDKAVEIEKYVDKEIIVNSSYAREIIDCIMERYNITERYGYRPVEDAKE